VPGPELLGPALSILAPILAGFLFGVGFWIAGVIVRRK